MLFPLPDACPTKSHLLPLYKSPAACHTSRGAERNTWSRWKGSPTFTTTHSPIRSWRMEPTRKWSACPRLRSDRIKVRIQVTLTEARMPPCPRCPAWFHSCSQGSNTSPYSIFPKGPQRFLTQSLATSLATAMVRPFPMPLCPWRLADHEGRQMCSCATSECRSQMQSV